MKIREEIAMQSRCAPRTPPTMLSGVRARVGTGARRPAGLRRASAIHQLLAPDQRRLIKLPNSIICADLQLIASRFFWPTIILEDFLRGAIGHRETGSNYKLKEFVSGG